MAMQNAGRAGVLHLYFGESNLPTPEFVKAAAREALASGYTFYTENAGMPSLRRALAGYYDRLHGVSIDPDTEIAVTQSGVQALNVVLRCMVDPGDEAIVLTPVWPNGIAILDMAHAKVVQIAHTIEEGRCGIDFDALEAAVTPRTRLLLYTSPSNPLGWVATVDDQQRLIEFARRHGLWLVADEVYERLDYSGKDASPSILKVCSREDAVVVVQSFSKAWCMTGWRLGWFIARKDLAAKAAQLNEYTISCVTGFVQKAGEAALSGGDEFLRGMRDRLRLNRDYCLEMLRSVPGVTVAEPQGAFYVFARMEAAKDSFGFCRRLLEETGLGLAPGCAFGAGGEGSVRICYASDLKILEDGMSRLRKFLAEAGQ